jgi:fructoselysine 6-kinase
LSGFDLAAVGDNCIDRFLPPLGLSTVGGNAVNVAVQLARLGHRAAYFGAVGDDTDGRRVLSGLTDSELDLTGLRIIAGGRTAYTDIATNSDGEREIRFEDFGVCRGYRASSADIERLQRMRHVHIGWLDDGGALKRRLQAAGISVSQDLGVNADAVHLAPQGLSVAFASAGPSEIEAEALLRQMLSAGTGIAVVTCGPLGSRASDGRARVAISAAPARVVDTTGAGDSFIAGFLDAHLGGADLAAALAAGAKLAALTCGHFGGFSQ